MNADEFVQCAKWWYEGRLLTDGIAGREMPGKADNFNRYSRREDPPAMPDEVWIADYKRNCGTFAAHVLRSDAITQHIESEQVRYVRADGIIDGRRIEYRARGRHNWASGIGWEYRIKP